MRTTSGPVCRMRDKFVEEDKRFHEEIDYYLLQFSKKFNELLTHVFNNKFYAGCCTTKTDIMNGTVVVDNIVNEHKCFNTTYVYHIDYEVGEKSKVTKIYREYIALKYQEYSNAFNVFNEKIARDLYYESLGIILSASKLFLSGLDRDISDNIEYTETLLHRRDFSKIDNNQVYELVYQDTDYIQSFASAQNGSMVTYTLRNESNTHMTEDAMKSSFISFLSKGYTDNLYIVQPGENMRDVSGRFNLTDSQLLNLNPQIRDPYLIMGGTVLVVR